MKILTLIACALSVSASLAHAETLEVYRSNKLKKIMSSTQHCNHIKAHDAYMKCIDAQVEDKAANDEPATEDHEESHAQDDQED